MLLHRFLCEAQLSQAGHLLLKRVRLRFVGQCCLLWPNPTLDKKPENSFFPERLARFKTM